MEEIKSPRLEKNYINSLPRIQFEGKIILINNDNVLKDCIQKLSKKKYIGFDTESKPAFKRGQYFPISLIQLSTEDTTYIIQRKYISVSILIPLLESTKVKKIGVALHEDMRKLASDLETEFTPKGFIDLSKIAREKGIIQIGARSLSARYLDKTISKSAQTSNWALKKLDQKQLIYAATDSWICLKIYPKLMADKTDYHAILREIEAQKEAEKSNDIESLDTELEH